MTKKVAFTKEYEREAVRVAETNGRTRREIADDLGIGLPTLTRWLSRSGDVAMDDPGRREVDEDKAAELKRLRRENEILRQERDILKKATAFFAKEGSRGGLASSIRREKRSPHIATASEWPYRLDDDQSGPWDRSPADGRTEKAAPARLGCNHPLARRTSNSRRTTTAKVDS